MAREIKHATLLEELLQFSEDAWVFRDVSTGKHRNSHKAIREPGEKTIVFRTVRGWYASESFGESINDIGRPEVVTYSQWKKARAAIAQATS